MLGGPVVGCFFLYILSVVSFEANADATAARPKNILHIVVDDLRTEIGAYNLNHKIYTPHIDELARQGVVFDRAYAQQALCNPSRASFMTGRRPDTTQIWNLNDNWRVKHMDWTSLPGMFKSAGMKSLGSGKTYHDTVQGTWQDALYEYDSFRSWSLDSLPYINPCWTQGVDCLPCPGTGWGGNVSAGWCVQKSGDLSDVRTTNHAIDLLNKVVKDGEAKTPFYLAVGYHKPHMPWMAKQEHFDLYPLEDIALAEHKTLDSSIPPIAFVDCDSESPTDPIPDEEARLARRAYYAATTGMDEEVGRLLVALEESGVANDTAVLFHGDHGWQLGEKSSWRKETNWEAAVRVPFMVKVPWMPQVAGTRSAELAELVDIMPTLADLAGIPTPTAAGDVKAPLEGVSLVPALEAAAAAAGGAAAGSVVKTAAFSQSPRRPKDESVAWKNNHANHADPTTFTIMGYSVRVSDWRYTEWRRWNGTTLQGRWDDDEEEGGGGNENVALFAQELYDHRDDVISAADYDEEENVNVVGVVENAEVVAELAALLREQYLR